MDEHATEAIAGGFRARDPIWHGQLDACATVDEVLTLVRDYIATLTPQHLARLPQQLRPGRVKGDDDIEYWTYKLAHARGPLGEEPVDAELLQDIFNHFLHASVRLLRIHKARAQATLATH